VEKEAFEWSLGDRALIRIVVTKGFLRSVAARFLMKEGV